MTDETFPKDADGLQLLIGGVLRQAVHDYRAALLMNDKGKQRKLEKFFRSEWFVFLVNDGIQGEFVIEKVREQCRMSKKS